MHSKRKHKPDMKSTDGKPISMLNGDFHFKTDLI